MGYRSNVKVLMSPKAFELLKENCLKSDIDYVKKMVDERYIQEKDDERVIMFWDDCKWYSNYEDVKAVEGTLTQLNELIEKDESLLADYFYKKIEIGEDGRIDESSNDEDDEFTSELYPISGFSI